MDTYPGVTPFFWVNVSLAINFRLKEHQELLLYVLKACAIGQYC